MCTTIDFFQNSPLARSGGAGQQKYFPELSLPVHFEMKHFALTCKKGVDLLQDWIEFWL